MVRCDVSSAAKEKHAGKDNDVENDAYEAIGEGEAEEAAVNLALPRGVEFVFVLRVGHG